MSRWKMVLLDVAIFAGLCWLPVGIYALGYVTKMPGPLLWLTTAVIALLGPIQFAMEVVPTYRRGPITPTRTHD